MKPEYPLGRIGFILLAALAWFGNANAQSAERWDPAPVIFDTDIGTDIDDAYALALILKSPELKLVGVTTVSGDAVARARLAAKLLEVAGGRWTGIPVYAGTSTATQYIKQAEWADGFSSPSLHTDGGVEFLREQINARPGEITIIAVGELTNIAALLKSEPGIGAKIRAIALMGGAIQRGYEAGVPPAPEWNIKSNAAAAQVVFTSGVPLLVAPLDSTMDLKLTPEWRAKIATGSPLNVAIETLETTWQATNPWKGKVPILFDALAVRLVNSPSPLELVELHVVVDDNGLTRAVAGEKPNARVALKADPAAFLQYFTDRVAGK